MKLRLFFVLGFIANCVACGGTVVDGFTGSSGGSGGSQASTGSQTSTGSQASTGSSQTSTGSQASTGSLTSGSAGTGGGSECGTNADCSAGDTCAYAIAEGCNSPSEHGLVPGTCVTPILPGPCNSIPPVNKACGCDGKEVDWGGGCAGGLPEGYAPAPVDHLGSCAMPGCTKDADCGPNQVCGFPVDGGCNAPGQCVAKGLISGDCNSIPPPACACDGTEVPVGCGANYATKPLLHIGPC